MSKFIRQSAGSGKNPSTEKQSRGFDTFYQILRATVEKIILDPEDEEYSVENIGVIEFRFLGENGSDPTNNKARPINSNMKLYPVLGEQVLIIDFANENYYFPPLNRRGLVNNNSMLGLTEEEQKKVDYTDNRPLPKSSSESDVNMGEYFKSNRSIPALQPFEGDFTIQGRFGNNIRLGSNPDSTTNMPNIKITMVDDPTDNKFDVIEENLDRDQCMWMTADETHIFEENDILIKGDGDTKIKSTTDDVWSGKQILLFSDRLIFRSKLNEIIGYSNLGIHWSSNKNFSVDSGDEVIINSKNNIETTTEKVAIFTSEGETQIQSLRTRIGKLDAKEPLVCGTLHQKILVEMLDLLIQHIHPTGTGPSGPTTVGTELGNLKQKFKDTLSEDNFTAKKNS